MMRGIRRQHVTQMLLTEQDDLVEALPTYRVDKPLRGAFKFGLLAGKRTCTMPAMCTTRVWGL